ncbi:GNAT family N-acetyltransferase [Heyndrickxia sp. NPDC080065]|uniref:GNAT family N-acetyltransferase n=1 Tax=Heyndrickxia sp. NPDC080065 TaxID=3390568 RepID=UPI003D0641CF
MNPILINVPTTIETKRLLLRMPMFGDGKVVNEAIKASINELQPWLPFAQHIPTEEETEINIREANLKFLKREDLRYLIFHSESKEFIGSTGLHNIMWEIPKCEIGYWIHTRFSGNGYMSEAINGLTMMALKQLKCKRVEIRCESTNIKSRTIPEKLGYQLEGVLRNEDLSADGKHLTDTCIYARIAL